MRVAQQPDNAPEGCAQLGPRHNEIDHAVIAQVFGALKPLGEFSWIVSSITRAPAKPITARVPQE